MKHLAAVLVLAATPAIGAAQTAAPGALLTTTHFAFYSDLATNVNDALIAAVGARRAMQPELFRAGPEQACFDALPASARDGWTRGVGYYVEGKSTGLQRLLLRLELAGLVPRDAITDTVNRGYLEEVAAIRAAATHAYQQCRWPAQDARNRAWLDQVRPLLARHEAAVGQELPRLYRVPWNGLPFRVDIVDVVSVNGGNSASPDSPTLHILISSSNATNQQANALEMLFHEASHFLTTPDSPLSAALAAAAREVNLTLPNDIVHQVHFFITGDAVRRVRARAGEAYTPVVLAQKLFPDASREAIARTWPAYLDGSKTMNEAAADLVQALAAAR